MVLNAADQLPETVAAYRTRLAGLMRACVAVGDIHTLQQTLQAILREARAVTHADAGSVYLREGDNLIFLSSQNDTLWPDSDGADTSLLRNLRLNVGCKSIAGYVAKTGRTINVADCYAIDPAESFQFNRTGDDATGYRSRALLALPLRDARGEIIGVLQLINRKPGLEGRTTFSAADEDLMASFCSIASISVRNAQLVEDLHRAHHETIARLAMAAESRDEDTGRHVQRMSLYSHVLALGAGLDQDLAQTLKSGATMHDIGKLAIPDRILKKPAGLTAEERAEMQRHTTYGAAILEGSQNPTLEMGRTICLTHHERWDGNGYPNNLRGEQIPLAGRIASIADVFDALCSRRCYHEARPFDEVLALLEGQSGLAFDPSLVPIFLRQRDAVQEIYEKHADLARPPRDTGELMMSTLLEHR